MILVYYGPINKVRLGSLYYDIFNYVIPLQNFHIKINNNNKLFTVNSGIGNNLINIS